MWAALKGDLQEFVSTVKDEGTTVLTAIDSKLEAHEREGESSPDGGENGTNVFVGEDGDIAYVDRSSGYEATGIVSSAADEVARLRECRETYTVPLLPDEEDKKPAAEPATEPVAAIPPHQDEGDDSPETRDTEGDIPAAADLEDVNKLNEGSQVEISATTGGTEVGEYDDVRAFLSTFDISSKTDDISALLVRYPDTVKVHFEELVPTEVTYEQFWKRYYYRCDEARVERLWEKEREEARRARQEAISGSINTVKNLLGGAVKAVSHIGGGGDDQEARGSRAYEKYQLQQPTHPGSKLFGSSGRPPFVMNTAVDESMVEDDDDEEELGWDDDDDDDYEDDDDEDEEGTEDDDADVEENEIVFASPDAKSADSLKDSELEEARQKLEQVEIERDQLHQTVEMQAKEIAELRLGTAEGDNEKELERLKMLLFEKDAELAAVKASLDDTHEESNKLNAPEDTAKIKALEMDVDRMTAELKTKENEVDRLREKLSVIEETVGKLQSEAGSDKASLEEARAVIDQMRSELEAAQAAARQTESEIDALRSKNVETQQKSASELATARREHDSALEKAKDLSSQLMGEKNQNEELKSQIDELTADIERIRSEMEEQALNFATTLDEEISKVRAEHDMTATSSMVPTQGAVDVEETSAASPSTFSSGVKVPSDPMMSGTSSGQNGNEVSGGEVDDDDDWGDSWGDDDG